MSAFGTAIFAINSSTATGVTLNALVVFSSLPSPVAPGTPLYSITVSPSTWTGTLTLSGANAGLFAVSGNQLVVGATPLPSGTYNITVTASP